MLPNFDLSPFSSFPTDILPNIFKDLSVELDKVALVCKGWQTVADCQSLRDAIRPIRAMGLKELETINPNVVDAGKELPLPRCAYRDFAKKGGLLFFNPGKIKVKNADGEVEEVVLNSLEAIGNLFKKPVTDLETGFFKSSWKKALKEERIVEQPHWVLIDTEVVGFNKTHEEQIKFAKAKDKKAYPGRYKSTAKVSRHTRVKPKQIVNFAAVKGIALEILKSFGFNKTPAKVSRHTTERPKQIVSMAGVNDVALGMLMAYAVLKEHQGLWNPKIELPAIVRVKDTTKDDDGRETQIVVLFDPSYGGFAVNDQSEGAFSHIGFVCARKFFGS
jgi:hypothetical protein